LGTDFFGCGQQSAARRTLAQVKPAARRRDTALGNALVAPGDDMCRQGIEQSLATTAPEKRSGRESSHSTRGSSRGRRRRCLLLPWRRSADRSRMQ
jgi:hypothetical protein